MIKKVIYIISFITALANGTYSQLSSNSKIYIDSKTGNFSSLDTAKHLLILGQVINRNQKFSFFYTAFPYSEGEENNVSFVWDSVSKKRWVAPYISKDEFDIFKYSISPDSDNKIILATDTNKIEVLNISVEFNVIQIPFYSQLLTGKTIHLTEKPAKRNRPGLLDVLFVDFLGMIGGVLKVPEESLSDP
jgi:hypothetical protein